MIFACPAVIREMLDKQLEGGGAVFSVLTTLSQRKANAKPTEKYARQDSNGRVTIERTKRCHRRGDGK
jgi:hypothetical protein